MADYPLGYTVGRYVNRLDIEYQDWPVESTEFKDGSRRLRSYAAAPRRTFRLEYDAIDRDWFETLRDHYLSHGGGERFTVKLPPRSSTPGLVYSTVPVRYLRFQPGRGPQGIDPWTHPYLKVELEEVIP